MKQTILRFVLVVACVFPAMGITAPVEDRDMKAALIYNFAVYTSWPENIQNNFNVCLFEEDEENINASLLESKKISGKQVSLKVIRTPSDIKGCQVLFIQDAKVNTLNNLDNISHTSILTIVEKGDNAGSQGIINLKIENNKFVFNINNQAAKQANLVLSSKLLRLAGKVY